MELLSPAGNLEKLQYAYEYGADAVYIGLKNFSLRMKADNFFDDEYKTIQSIKTYYAQKGKPKKLSCAFNADAGIVEFLQKHFPNTALHLSTQANCLNMGAVKVYKSLGFSRIVMAREASLKEISEIKEAIPEMEIECFVHGAMCMAYSGRCLISSYLTDRSANAGHCSHSCRW